MADKQQQQQNSENETPHQQPTRQYIEVLMRLLIIKTLDNARARNAHEMMKADVCWALGEIEFMPQETINDIYKMCFPDGPF